MCGLLKNREKLNMMKPVSPERGISGTKQKERGAMDTVRERIAALSAELREDLIRFAQELVRTKSNTCCEGAAAELVAAKMRALGYDSVEFDDMGNVLGRIGSGRPSIFFDSHTDAVDVKDADAWSFDPYGGEIIDGMLCGRGAADMKSGLAASVYGAYIAKQAGALRPGRAVYVSASSMEEDYDGEALKCLLQRTGLRPERVIVCEPTNDMQIAHGHRGRALIEVHAQGVGCHGSRPELGKNPVYMLEPIIARVQALQAKLSAVPGEHGSVALTNIYCTTASNNSVPMDATLILDRRVTIPETEAYVAREMDELVRGTACTWRYCDIPGTSWRGKDFLFHSYMAAWEIGTDHALVQSAVRAYRDVVGGTPELFKFNGNTNAISTAGLYQIPSIIIGPGDLTCAHAKDERCSVEAIVNAGRIYALLCADAGEAE